jgi:hypothetical protein
MAANSLTLHSLYKKTQQTNLAITMSFLFLPTICCWCSKDWKYIMLLSSISLFVCLFVYCTMQLIVPYLSIKQWLFYLVGKAHGKGQP